MNVAFNTLQVIKSLWRIQTNETVVYAQYPAGEPPFIDPSIAHLVKFLKKDQLVLLFRKRLSSSDQVSLIAVGVSPDITKKITSIVEHYEQKLRKEREAQPELDVELELRKVFG